jgi:protein O-GlcNAc transferase
LQQLRVSVEDAKRWLDEGTIAVAEMLLRPIIQLQPNNAAALQLMAEVARRLGETWWAAEYERRAAGGSVPTPMEPAAESGPEKFLLIKAWGNGFCSDLDHTLGHLLLAEMTGRTPIIHWGRNSRFGVDPERDAYSLYFEPVNARTIDDVIGKGYDFFPPKWNDENLRRENQSKIAGEWSRLPPYLYFNRPERVAVADIYAGVINLAPWIRPGHPMHGRHIVDVYRYLITRYLKPRPEIVGEIEAFEAAHFTQRPVIGAHVRGSDKHKEDPQLAQKIGSYPATIAKFSEGHWFPHVFLLTDSVPMREDFAKRYGPCLITTDCSRTSSMDKGPHLEPSADRRRLGIEVMKDAYLAARCDRFIGIGSSNVSCFIYHLKDWPKQDVVMVGPLMTHLANPYLYMSIDQLVPYMPPETIAQLRDRARADEQAMSMIAQG